MTREEASELICAELRRCAASTRREHDLEHATWWAVSKAIIDGLPERELTAEERQLILDYSA
jgi:hypothetical protein